jgi:hypothetical protein
MPNRRKSSPNPRKKNSWGGYTINFEGQSITMEELYGDKNIGCGRLLAVLWQYAKANGCTSKSRPYAPPRVLKRDRVPLVASQ